MKERLKRARKASGKTQKEIADILGITESTYCGYETGKRRPDAIKIAQLASALGVSGDYLLGRAPDPAPEDVIAKTDNEKTMLRLFRQLDEDGQDAILKILKK